eukprot:NODE_110_length_18645_cov_0.794403.p15 type:complete len:173 gc:universal NODE_110_length_18645_cov_0.794403:13505-12987(-)
MATLRRFKATDIFDLSIVNLDPLTENYNISFYLQYLSWWPNYNKILLSNSGTPMSYLLAKEEGEGEWWHGHVTAITTASVYRRQGLAKMLMKELERIGDVRKCYFIDLFVRASNSLAISMYRKLGYEVYREVIDYYDDENAFDMRKSLKRDAMKKLMIPLKKPIHTWELETW